jgi:tetrahydromethanopterin S-methyltransferase subunit B
MPHVGAPLDSETSEYTGIITGEFSDEDVELSPEEIEETLRELEQLAELDEMDKTEFTNEE